MTLIKLFHKISNATELKIPFAEIFYIDQILYIGIWQGEPFSPMLLYIMQLFVLYCYIFNTFFYKELVTYGTYYCCKENAEIA